MLASVSATMSLCGPHLFALPLEVRMMIYKFSTPTVIITLCDTVEEYCPRAEDILDSSGFIHHESTSKPCHHNPHVSLALVNKQVYAETKALMAESRIDLTLCSYWCVDSFLWCCPRPVLNRVRHLTYVNVCQADMEDYKWPLEGGRCKCCEGEWRRVFAVLFPRYSINTVAKLGTWGSRCTVTVTME